jgi:membrane protease YdiL (CAAX protease family)
MNPVRPASFAGRVVILNSVAGLVYGWLYRRRSLEAAVVAHAATHIAFAVLAIAGIGS